MSVTCSNRHPHGAVYFITANDHGKMHCSWCDWESLMIPEPGQYAEIVKVDPFKDPHLWEIEKKARSAKQEERRRRVRESVLLKQRSVAHATA